MTRMGFVADLIERIYLGTDDAAVHPASPVRGGGAPAAPPQNGTNHDESDGGHDDYRKDLGEDGVGPKARYDGAPKRSDRTEEGIKREVPQLDRHEHDADDHPDDDHSGDLRRPMLTAGRASKTLDRARTRRFPYFGKLFMI
jgi:hypothetical protein